MNKTKGKEKESLQRFWENKEKFHNCVLLLLLSESMHCLVSYIKPISFKYIVSFEKDKVGIAQIVLIYCPNQRGM